MPAVLPDSTRLHVVTAVVNPCRYESREKLYWRFRAHMEKSGAVLTTVEGVFGERLPMIPDAIHVPVQDVLWHKENMLGIGFASLPSDAKYIAWFDADIEFMQENWVAETLHALQHYDVVQPFSTALDLGPERLGEHAIQLHKGFCYQYCTGKPIIHHVGGAVPYEFAHPGYAWAARRSAMDKVGGLMDWTLLGAGDHIMALAMIGRVRDSMAGGLNPNFYAMAYRWQYMAESYIRRNIGYVPGLIHHHWHGTKENRRYVSRWDILKQYQYDPKVDISRDLRGVIRLTGNKPDLRDALRRYFSARNEDSQDL